MGIRNKRYLVVGDGAAGMTAARTLRETDPQAEITIIADDPNPAYFRAALTNYLLGELREEQIWATRPQFYDQFRVRRLHARCNGIDTQRGELHTSLGTPLAFDALLLGCGARARRPTFAGSGLGGVLTLRTLQDCRAIMERIASGRVSRAVVLGGGPLALEWALGMHARGINVSVMLRGSSFMPGALDAVGSDLLAARLRQAGLNLILNDEAAQALPGPDGNVAALTSQRGQRLECQLVAAAIGVVPNTEWLEHSGIRLGKRKGVVVTPQMQSSAAGVYAAGDVVEFEGKALQLWEPAQAQARVAARNMVGTPAHYAPGVHYMATRLFDLDFASLGQVTDVTGAREIVDLPKGTGRLNYRKVMVHQGQLVGAVMLGHREDRVRQRGRWFKRIMDWKLDVSSIADQLLDPSFDIASWFDQKTGADNAPLAAVPDGVSAGHQTGASANVATGADLRGTSVLALSQLTQMLTNASSEAAPTNGKSAPLAETAHAPTAFHGGPASAPENQAATAALGTQMLGQFNLRPQAPAITQQAPERKAFVRLEQRHMELSGSLCRIGREAGSEIHSLNPSVSFVHAHVERAGAHWYLRDLGSEAGTWVNGAALSAPRKLESGDRIRVGQVELVFYYEGEENRADVKSERRAHGAPKARLQVRSGHALGLEFLLTESPTFAGNDPSCQLWLDETSLVPKHARFERQQSGWQVVGLDASAGVWVNQRALAPNTPAALKEGTTLRLGAIEMSFTHRPLQLGIDEIRAQRQAVAGTEPDPTRQGTGQRMQAFAAIHPDSFSATAPPPFGDLPQRGPRPAAMMDPALAATAAPTSGSPTPATGPAAASVIHLRVEAGPDTGRAIPIRDYVVVGHQPSCQLVLSDQSVAPQHVEVQRFSGALFARNLSTPGTLSKNGEDTGTRSVPLAVGDRLQVGPQTVLVLEETQ